MKQSAYSNHGKRASVTAHQSPQRRPTLKRRGPPFTRHMHIRDSEFRIVNNPLPLTSSDVTAFPISPTRQGAGAAGSL